MLGNQPSGAQGGCTVDRKLGIARILHYVEIVPLQFLRTGQFAKTYFGRNLPRGGGRNENHIALVRNRFLGFTAQGGRRKSGPEDSAGVEQNLHSPPSFHRRSSSSGSGSKNCSERTNPGVSRAPSRFFRTG